MRDGQAQKDLVSRWHALGLNAQSIAKATGMAWRTVDNVEKCVRPSRKSTLRAIDAYLREREYGEGS